MASNLCPHCEVQRLLIFSICLWVKKTICFTGQMLRFLFSFHSGQLQLESVEGGLIEDMVDTEDHALLCLYAGEDSPQLSNTWLLYRLHVFALQWEMGLSHSYFPRICRTHRSRE